MRARSAAIAILAAVASTGCAVTNTPYPPQPPPIVHRPAPGPNHFTSAAPVPLHGELFACASMGANIGAIGARGEVALYRPYIYTAAGPLLRLPAEMACLSSGFGWRGVESGGGRMHNGLDYANPAGGYVYAAGDGWVRFADWRNGYGLVLEIDHGQGVRTLYAHLAEIDANLAPGAFVAAGAAVARMGASGNATGIHLHYEVAVDGLTVDPLAYGTEPPPAF